MKKWFLVVAVLATGSAQAWACSYEKDIDVSLDLSGAEQLAIQAGAGDLRIRGLADTTEARVRGKVCASKEKWLEASELVTEGGTIARIATSLPDIDSGWRLLGGDYLSMDLDIEVPAGLALEVRDSSGDMELRGTGGARLRDSSGDIEVADMNGSVQLEDSSGDIELRGIAGDVLVQRDSSGDIDGRGILGQVRIERDSSGDIRFSDVRDGFVVERDSSGDIIAATIGGDFRVLSDGSGSVRQSDVSGEVEIP